VTVTPSDEFDGDVTAGRWPARVVVHSGGETFTEQSSRATDAAPLGPCVRGDDRLIEKWDRMLLGQDRRGFFENVVNRQTGSHAMLWEWVKQRLAGAAA
jgi:hypothetical protein